MEEVSTNWWPIIGVVVAIVGVIYAALTYHKKPKPAPRTLQTMENSTDSTQTATRDDVQQEMTNSKGGKQKA